MFSFQLYLSLLGQGFLCSKGSSPDPPLVQLDKFISLFRSDESVQCKIDSITHQRHCISHQVLNITCTIFLKKILDKLNS